MLLIIEIIYVCTEYISNKLSTKTTIYIKKNV